MTAKPRRKKTIKKPTPAAPIEPTWVDASFYSQGDRGVISPWCWELTIGWLHLIVWRNLCHGDDAPWNGRCYPVIENSFNLETTDLAAAKLRLVERVTRRLQIGVALLEDKVP